MRRVKTKRLNNDITIVYWDDEIRIIIKKDFNLVKINNIQTIKDLYNFLKEYIEEK